MGLTQVGYYRILRLLGEGGMGSVYEAEHTMTGRHVALKTLRAELSVRADLNGRFFNEARAMSFLEHPGIARVFDVGRSNDGLAYMVMELCPGETLGAVMQREALLRKRLSLVAAVADALTLAHDKGVIHRDLKPENVIVVSGADGPQPKVLDFGIAKVLENEIVAGAHAVKTRTGSVMGTPLYMSPEQCRGSGGITRATDVYSLGVMLYEAIAGYAPFNGGVGETLVHHISTPVPPLPLALSSAWARGLSALCLRMLSKEAAARPSMPEVVVELSTFATMMAGAPSHSETLIPLDGKSPTLVAPFAGVQGAKPTDDPVVFSSVPAASRVRSTPVFLTAGVLVVAGVSFAIWSTRPRPNNNNSVAPPTQTSVAPTMPPPTTPPPKQPSSWLVESEPSGVDVFTSHGVLVGQTPFTADALLARGERKLFLRKQGYADQIVRYSGRDAGVAKMRVQRPRSSTHEAPAVEQNNSDEFEVKPLH